MQQDQPMWSPSDHIEVLGLIGWETSTLHDLGVRTLEELLQLPSNPRYQALPLLARRIAPLIDEVRQLLQQEDFGDEEEDAALEPQLAIACGELDEQLTLLEEHFSPLGTQLSQIAREITDSGGVLPSAQLLEDLTAARNDFLDLRTKVLHLAHAFDISPLPQPDEIMTLRALRSLLDMVAQVEEQRAMGEHIYQRALTVLERVLQLVYRDSDNFPPLVECQAKARELGDAVSNAYWPAVHPDTAALAEGTHPFAALLSLSERWNDLGPRAWESLLATVRESFGPELAVQAARGMLIVPQESEERDEEEGVIPEPPIDLGSPITVGKPASPNLSVPASSDQPRYGSLSLSDSIDVLQSLLEPAVADRLRYFHVRTIEDLLTLSERNPPRPNMADPTLQRIYILIAHVVQLLKQEPPNFEGAEELQSKPQIENEGSRIPRGPLDREGRPRELSPTDPEELGEPGDRPDHSKPEIVCWKREQQWMVAIEVPDELVEQYRLKVRQNGECLGQDAFNAGCWLLQQAAGQVVIHWEGSSVAKTSTVTLGDEGYLLFKLQGQDLNQGRRITTLSTGSYLIMAPENWERDEVPSGANLVEPELVSLPGYRAHFYAFESRGGQILFRTPEGKLAVIGLQHSLCDGVS